MSAMVKKPAILFLKTITKWTNSTKKIGKVVHGGLFRKTTDTYTGEAALRAEAAAYYNVFISKPIYIFMG